MTLARSGWTWGSLSLFFTLCVQALEDEVESSNSTTVVVLLLIFLILFTAFIVAWYHLNQVTKGQYHPRNLWRGHDGEEEHAGPAARLVLAAAGTWRTVRSWVMGEAAEEQEQLQENGEKTEMKLLSKEVQDGEDGGSQWSKGKHDDGDNDDEESSSNEPNSEDDYSSLGGRDIRDGANTQEPEETEEEPKAGSSEALLCDLHAFSGSAVWQDESLQAPGRLDVTAL